MSTATRSPAGRSCRGWAHGSSSSKARRSPAATPPVAARLALTKGPTEPVRHTGSVIYQVAAGHGWSEVGGQRFEWEEKDIFCVPSWALYRHGCPAQAVLL